MTQPFSSLRGAVDLGALATSRPGAPAAPSQGGPAAPSGDAPGAPIDGARDPFASPVVVVGDDASFNQIVQRSVSVPTVAVLWTSQAPETQAVLAAVVDVAERKEGRLQVVAIDLSANPGIAQAIQPPQLPVTLGLLQGQAIPLFQGLPSPQDLERVVDELLTLAVQQGVTGRVEVPAGDGDAEQAMPPLHEEAYAAIERGDLEAAAKAYEQAIAENPADEDARLGLAQVSLMVRTQGVDLQAARAAAAADPTDVDAAILVADCDVLGGHVEDAFTRLLDLVRTTAGDDRDRVKTHLLDLFAVVGNQDERVRRGRTALMSALF